MNEIKKILVPIDFSDYSKSSLRYSVDFALNFNASLHLVYVIEPAIYPADFSMGQISVPAIEVETTEKAQEELSRLASEIIADKLDSTTEIRTGRPFIEIIECASEQNSDLIIIATHGHTGVEHLLFGSTAEKVVRKAPCPVLTLREPIKGFKFNG
ncbi:MAG: universal stress protein [Melioribacteraceae bacterium]|nr:MAG: universal stress protein [Melioribacteraceae bacterium]